MGIPFYGRSFVLNNPSNHLPGKMARSKKEGFSGPYTEENGFLSYFEICTMAKESTWLHKRDDDGNVYMHSGNKWVGYDTPDAVGRKINYVKTKGYGGGMIWAIDLDDFNGLCGDGKWPLLSKMQEVFSSKDVISEQHIQIEQPDIEASGAEPDEETIQTEDDLDVTVIGAGLDPIVEENGEMESTSHFNCPSLGIHPSPHCDSFYMCSE